MSLRDRIAGLWAAGSEPPPADERAWRERVDERLAHLEALVEGLQDAVHRDSVRHEERMAELERKTEPAELAKALSDDARRRGL